MVLSGYDQQHPRRLHPRVLETQAERSSLWFSQYAWAVTWFQYEISVLRQGLEPADIHKALANRRYWEKNRYDMRSIGKGMPEFRSSITPDCERNVVKVGVLLQSADQPYKMIVSNNHISIYTNDRSFVDSLAAMAESVTLGSVLIRQAVIAHPQDTIILKRPYDYQYRTWFKSRHLEMSTINTLQEWVENMGREVYACPSLRKFLRGDLPRGWLYRAEWTQDHYFLDHNDPKLEVWLAMLCPGLVKKTQAIQSPAK